MKITLYTENGTVKAYLYSVFAEKFLSTIINRTKQIKLKSGEKAFEYDYEDEALYFGIESSFIIIARKGDFFTIG
jgi:hypothetical protein